MTTDINDYFDQVYNSTVERLLRYVVIRTPDAADVEDVMQDTYRKFYLRLKRKGGSDLGSPEAYLVSIAKHELAARYRRRAARPEAPFDDSIDVPSELPPLEEAAAARLDAEQVWRIAKAEPLLSYKVFVLFYGMDIPLCDIAMVLGISEQAAKSRLYRTRCAVRAQLKERIEP